VLGIPQERLRHVHGEAHRRARREGQEGFEQHRAAVRLRRRVRQDAYQVVARRAIDGQIDRVQVELDKPGHRLEVDDLHFIIAVIPDQ